MEKFEVSVLQKKKSISVNVPGSKSITNRVFLIASLADGISIIHNALESDDTKYMQESLKLLGIDIEKKSNTFVIHGKGGKFDEGEKQLFLGNAGTAVRFLTAAMILRKDISIIDGNERMRERPILDLLKGLKTIGAKVYSKTGCPPVTIKGLNKYKNIVYLNGKKSSQYFSALMQVAPCLENGLHIFVDGELVSKPYIDITINVIKNFGVDIINNNYKDFHIPSQKYLPCEYYVEGDASSASYWFGLAAVTGSSVTVENLSYNSCQGDVHFIDVLEKMGCKITKKKQGITIKGPKILKALGEINMNSMPDTAMTLAIIASLADGETIITDVANMRIKETDRIHALVTEMQKIGIKCVEMQDGIKIKGTSDISKYHPSDISTYDDHRMAMCFAVLGTRVPGITILNPDCTSKTYPRFFEEWKNIL